MVTEMVEVTWVLGQMVGSKEVANKIVKMRDPVFPYTAMGDRKETRKVGRTRKDPQIKTPKPRKILNL